MTDESLFDKLAADELRALESALLDLDGVEVDLAADVLTLEFDDGRQFIVNSHRAARQIWMSAAASAWHFTRDEVSGRWIDTRGGRELRELLRELLTAKLGREIPAF